MYSWLDMFRDTITCPSCKEHFTAMLANYRSQFPNMLSSRQEFAMFSFRAHNAVNRRLSKPVRGTLGECMDTLQYNIKTRSASEYRVAYLAHITRHWIMLRDVTGIVAIKKIREMNKIEADYIRSRDTNFKVDLNPDPVVLPSDVLDKNPNAQGPVRPSIPRNMVGAFRITGNGIRLRR